MLKLSRVYKLLGGRAVLDSIDLECKAGETVVVLGPNGSGKSTLLRAIAGVLDLDAGEIEIGGRSLQKQPALAKAQLGYAPDGMEALPDLRASELVRLVRGLKALGPELHGDELRWQQQLGFPELAPRRLLSLSFGQRKRVTLVAALAGLPRLLLLDEPSAGLDPAGESVVSELVRWGSATGRAHVITTNDEQLAARLGGSQRRFISGKLEGTSASIG